jgi:hypothetical protein
MQPAMQAAKNDATTIPSVPISLCCSMQTVAPESGCISQKRPGAQVLDVILFVMHEALSVRPSVVIWQTTLVETVVL